MGGPGGGGRGGGREGAGGGGVATAGQGTPSAKYKILVCILCGMVLKVGP